MAVLTTGELAKRGSVNLESIRFYEREGLLPKPARSPAGYRQFPEDAAQRLRFIKRAQELGFTLREIKDLLALRIDPGTKCSEVRQRAQAKLADIDHKIRDLRRMRAALVRLTNGCSGRGTAETCPILQSLDHNPQ